MGPAEARTGMPGRAEAEERAIASVSPRTSPDVSGATIRWVVIALCALFWLFIAYWLYGYVA